MVREGTATEERDTRAVRRDAMREKILKAAWRIARRDGLAALSLREIAKVVGMRAPSLYSYFDSKHAIYDAMFAQGNKELMEHMARTAPSADLSRHLRERARLMFEFNRGDITRYQLMFQRTIPGFEPSPESYAHAVTIYDSLRRHFADAGYTDQRVLDLWTALISGMFQQQIANEPESDRWERLIDDAVDMFLKHIGYPSKRKGATR